MSRTQILLLLLISVEVAGGGWLLAGRLYRPLPPVPDLTGYNPYTSQQLVALAKQVNPDAAEDWANLGDAYLAHGFFPESESCLRRAVELTSDDASLKYRWALTLSSMGRLDDAKQRLHDALDGGHARPADCWYLIGRDCLRQERVEEARAAFQQAGELPAARFELAKLDVRSGRAEAARPILEQVEAELPNAHRPHLLRAQAESMLGNDAMAASYRDLSEVCSGQLPTPTHEFRTHILATFDRYSVAKLVGSAAELRGNRRGDQAETLLREAMGAYWDQDVEDLRATLALDRGDLTSHLQQLEAIVERDGPDSYRLWRLGVALSTANQLDAAAEAFRAAATLDTDAQAIDSLEQLSIIYGRLGDRAQANRYAARLRYAMGMQLFRQTKLVEARAALRESVRIDDEYPHAWFYLGEIGRYMSDLPAARDAYDRCLELNPDHGRALDARGRLDVRGGIEK